MGTLRKIRGLMTAYSRAFGTSIEDMIRDALLGTFALMVLVINAALLLAAAGGGR